MLDCTLLYTAQRCIMPVSFPVDLLLGSNKSAGKETGKTHLNALHRGAFCQLPFRWIYYYGSNESTGK